MAGPFSLALREGAPHGPGGRNGIGKSTLLRTLCRLQPRWEEKCFSGDGPFRSGIAESSPAG